MTLSIIVAVSKNHAIGKDNQLPWHLPADLQYFKRVTMGKPIIMGRKTYESIGRPLPGRLNIVVSRQLSWSATGVEVVSSLAAAVALAEQHEAAEVMLIGGAQMYKAGLELADTLYLTKVDVEVDGDAFFPPIDNQSWVEVSRSAHPADEKNAFACDFIVYRREGNVS